MRNTRPDAPVEMDARELVWLGETADGTRDEDLQLVLDKNDKARLRKTLEPGDRPVAKVKTKNHQPERVKILKVTCQADKYAPIDLLREDDFDAVFWTESAVEKFLYPYYHSQRLWDPEMEDLKTRFENDPLAAAIAHKAPSKSLVQYVRPADGVVVGRVVRGPDSVPTLEWLTVSEYLALE